MHSFFAVAARGTEAPLVEELKELGAQNVREERGGVAFESPTLEVPYRACLWSRIATRVLMPLGKFPASDPDRLYAGVRKIHWTDHLDADQTLAIDFAMSGNPISGIQHPHFGALKAKDAICDQFRAIQGQRPSVDPARPDVRINLHVHDQMVTVSLDLSGESLHRRAYRTDGAKAPLKESLAAAMLRLAGWPQVAAQGGALVDPMCGSGTIVTEAAFMALDRAPGLGREYYGFLGWQGHVPALWKRLEQEARDRFRAGVAKRIAPIVGYDQDVRAVRAAISNLERAQLSKKVHIEKREMTQCEPPQSFATVGPKGLLVVNPPYGERLGEVNELKPLYRSLGDLLKKRFTGWEGYILTGSPELSKEVGLAASRRFVLMNGPIECRLLKYELFAGAAREAGSKGSKQAP